MLAQSSAIQENFIRLTAKEESLSVECANVLMSSTCRLGIYSHTKIESRLFFTTSFEVVWSLMTLGLRLDKIAIRNELLK